MFKNLINRIKITFCCRSKCSLNEEYDYYSGKEKQFKKEPISAFKNNKKKIHIDYNEF